MALGGHADSAGISNWQKIELIRSRQVWHKEVAVKSPRSNTCRRLGDREVVKLHVSDILPDGRRERYIVTLPRKCPSTKGICVERLTRAMAARSVHVAGVIDLAEAELLIDCGVRYLGFPFVLDHHKEDLTTDAAAAIVSKLRGHATFFLITYLNRAESILELCQNLSVDMVQLHGETDLEQIRRLKQEAPHLRIIKSLIVRGNNTDTLADEVRRFEVSVDSFITDTFDPVTGASGATGRLHDWEISRRLVASSAKPLILAGGLNAGNVREAIRRVRPAGVDVHTGIEGHDGRKLYDLTRRFVEEAQLGFSEIE